MTASYVGCNRALIRARARIGAAECHGLLCGMLCGLEEGAPGRWLEEVLGSAPPTGGRGNHECREILSELLVDTVRTLYADDYRFVPFLPEDTESLAVRSEALAAWCSGFLYGIGTGGEDIERRLSGEAREVLSDLSEVTRLVAVAEESEALEADYMEVVEYMRVGVMLIFEELRSDAKAADARSRPH